MVQLLKFALRDPPMNKMEKFVFLSDSTLPVKPFGHIYESLSSTSGSDLCVFPSHHWGTAKVGFGGIPASSMFRTGETAYLVKHHQWLVLNREHAQVMVANWKPVDKAGHWDVK